LNTIAWAVHGVEGVNCDEGRTTFRAFHVATSCPSSATAGVETNRTAKNAICKGIFFVIGLAVFYDYAKITSAKVDIPGRKRGKTSVRQGNNLFKLHGQLEDSAALVAGVPHIFIIFALETRAYVYG
jgi:hypothetical protein